MAYPNPHGKHECAHTIFPRVKIQHNFFPSFICLSGGNEIPKFTLWAEYEHEKFQPKGSIFQKYLSTQEPGLEMKVSLEPSLSFTTLV